MLTGATPGLYVTHYDVAEILDGVEAVGVSPRPLAAGALLRLAGAISASPRPARRRGSARRCGGCSS